MARQMIGRIITGIAGLGFLGTAALHGTGYGAIVRLVEQAPAELEALGPALWLSFSFDLTVLGLIVGVVAIRPSAGGRLILVIAALCPIGAAALQLCFLGFIPPTGILLAIAGLTLAGAAILPPDGGQAAALPKDAG